jgi:hypothetical protein
MKDHPELVEQNASIRFVGCTVTEGFSLARIGNIELKLPASRVSGLSRTKSIGIDSACIQIDKKTYIQHEIKWCGGYVFK